MTITEQVRFLMPKSREYQFAAFAVVQQFVNGFQAKCRNNDVSDGVARYELRYQLVMPEEDLAFFVAPLAARLQSAVPASRLTVGLILDQMPERELDAVTMEVDFTEERLHSIRETGRKHIVQACGLLCGILVSALPKVRRVEIQRCECYNWLEMPTVFDLLAVKDYAVTGVVGWRGVETYMAAAMGLAVIELDRPDYPDWLPKWINWLYRRIEVPHAVDSGDESLRAQIDAAKRSAELTLKEIIRLCSQVVADPEPGLNPTERTQSSVTCAASS